MEAAQARVTTRESTHLKTPAICCSSVFFLLTSWWESPLRALRAPRPQTRACWWSCICSTAVLRRSSTWEHKQLLHKGPLLIPQLCAHTNDPESCLTTLFYIPRRAEGSPLGERWSVRAKVITVSNPESRMTIIQGFLNRVVPSLRSKTNSFAFTWLT